jgi:DNA-directed RNA polymerase specialized sigma24 family protein
MLQGSGVSRQGFERLLEWLHSDRERAGQTYEEIRRRLIRFFTCRACTDPDSLADVVIDRVNNAIMRPDFEFSGEPILLFYGFARNVCLEHQRQAARPRPLPGDLYVQPEDPLPFQCLESCVGMLSPNQRKMILSYYQYEPGAKTENREQLAQEYGMALNALRIRVHRIRLKLRECIMMCTRLRNYSQ